MLWYVCGSRACRHPRFELALRSPPQIGVVALLLAIATLASGCALRVRTPEITKAQIFNFKLSGTIQVEAAYPVNGSNWMDYVTVTNPIGGTDTRYNQPDTACAGTETGYDGCIHGGEIRKLALSGVSSCDDLSAVDALGVFDWVCDDSSGTATFYSTGLKDGKGLVDLIASDGSAFKSNAVTITQRSTGASLASTNDAIWWTNPFAPLPDNNATSALALDGTDDDGAGPDQAFTEGTILTLATSRGTMGYNINEDKLALVTLPGATLTLTTTNAYYSGATGEMSGTIDSCAALSGGSQKFLWLEGTFATSAVPDGAVGLRSFSHSRINQVTFNGPYDGLVVGGFSDNLVTHVSGTSSTGASDFLWMLNSASNNTNNTFYDLKGRNYGDSCIHLENSIGNTFDQVRCSNMGEEGITLISGSNQNAFHDVIVANTATALQKKGAIYIESNDNVFTQVLVTGTDLAIGNMPIYVNGGQRNIFNQVTTAYNSDSVYLANAVNNTFNQLTVMGSQGVGIRDGSGSNNTFSQVANANNADFDLNLSSVISDKFTGNIWIGANGCAVSGGTNPGLTDTTCAAQGLSDGVITTGVSLASTLVGTIGVEDTANQSDSTGTATYPGTPSLFDWWNFDEPFRAWGNGTSRWTSGVGNIEDFRIKSSDSVILNRSGMNLGTQGAQENESFVAGATCPSAVGGNIATTDQAGHTYLLNAVEILGDGIGNDNGLCEANESCLYTPNFGAYQGQGDLAACVFNDAGGTTTVTGVSIVGYTQNGA